MPSIRTNPFSSSAPVTMVVPSGSVTRYASPGTGLPFSRMMGQPSFHVIGEIFDKVYESASLTGAPLADVQTTSVPPGGATVVEMKLEVPGQYVLVDHALSRVERGLAGILEVTGPENPTVFEESVPEVKATELRK